MFSKNVSSKQNKINIISDILITPSNDKKNLQNELQPYLKFLNEPSTSSTICNFDDNISFPNLDFELEEDEVLSPFSPSKNIMESFLDYIEVPCSSESTFVEPLLSSQYSLISEESEEIQNLISDTDGHEIPQEKIEKNVQQKKISDYFGLKFMNLEESEPKSSVIDVNPTKDFHDSDDDEIHCWQESIGSPSNLTNRST